MDPVGGWAGGRLKIAAVDFLRVVSMVAGGGSKARTDCEWRFLESVDEQFFNNRPRTRVRIPFKRCDSQGGLLVYDPI